ncbi:DNA polymerase III subunit gamma and tau [Kytococcus sedentarius]|uniref:DNA polymerase III subunit gamma and tau n=1 Tax=Kytococcus sedentarius TaxID=1276 RepID=UPI00384B948E
MSTALYRRYRPQNFSEVVGQEHVTGPLQQALRTGRVNHAYLFSGPRGCGKTTSARILARCLNCEQGPTDSPCGECDSCQDLARGGAGSVDVIEIDAASHGGVDDARDLREKASFGPAQSRYKVYIIDEAHMVTSAGFNALLKIVEEPPEHVLFIFATTEPEKVIGTIRSRTHHYPFRLVPPAVLQEYLAQVCEREGITVEPGVLSYVVRAGGGSVRDSMSVLDQLIAGSGDAGITLAGTTALLGFTDSELLDGVVDAYAAGDGASLFTTVERVVESGQDPRRFVEDLSERMRDLILVNAVPTGTEAVLPGVPSDQLDRLRVQASGLGPAELSRASDVLFHGLAEMTGATSPRLQLEIIMARLLLPRAAGEGGFAARLEKVERWMAFRGDAAAGGTAGAQAVPAAAAPQQEQARAPEPARQAPHGEERAQERLAPPQQSSEQAPPVAEEPPADMWEAEEAEAAAGPDSAGDRAPEPDAPQQAQQAAPEGSSSPGAAPVPLETLRHEWPTVLDKLKDISRVTWALVSQSMQVQDLSAEGLTLATEVAPIAERFSRGENADRVAAAVQEALGFHPRVRCVVGGRGDGGQSGSGGPGGAGGPGGRGTGGTGGAPGSQGAGGVSGLPSAPDPVGSPAWGQRTDDAPDWATGDLPAPTPGPGAGQGGDGAAPAGAVPPPAGEPTPGAAAGAAPAGAPASAPGGGAGTGPDPSEATPEEDGVEFTPDYADETVESVGMVGTAAIEKILGGTVIEEHSDQA